MVSHGAARVHILGVLLLALADRGSSEEFLY